MSVRDGNGPTIEQIRRLYPQNRRKHQHMFKSYLDLIRESQKVHLLSITVAQRAIAQQVDVGFMNAYVALMTRTVTNLESIVQLFEIGNWGIMFYSKPDYAQHMHFNLSPVPEMDMLWSVQIMGLSVSFLLQLIPSLLEREPIIQHNIKGLPVLAAATRAVARIRTDFTNRIYKELDIIEKVWMMMRLEPAHLL